MPEPDAWQCPRCGTVWPSRAARDRCEREDFEADRDARRR